MTDTLRTRIAAAIERSLVEQFPPNLPDRYGDWIKNDALADAVIRELCMHRQEMGEWDVLAQGFRGHRYVTHWEENE